MELRPEATDEGGKGGIFCVAVLPRSAARDWLVRIEDNLGANGASRVPGELIFRLACHLVRRSAISGNSRRYSGARLARGRRASKTDFIAPVRPDRRREKP